MNEPNYLSDIHVFHYSARVMYRAHILHRQAVFRAQIHEKFQLAQCMFGVRIDYRWVSSRTLILSLFASHVSSPYSVQIYCKPSIITRISSFDECHVQIHIKNRSNVYRMPIHKLHYLEWVMFAGFILHRWAVMSSTKTPWGGLSLVFAHIRQR